ncbi:MAG: hypothetical protein RIT45_2091 [Pseudomonadota bacterium]
MALGQWAADDGVEMRFIAPGNLTQNPFIESFDGRFRHECLNENRFVNLLGAIETLEPWGRDYNEGRTSSTIGPNLGGHVSGRSGLRLQLKQMIPCMFPVEPRPLRNLRDGKLRGGRVFPEAIEPAA